jgi:hypothetical protein
LLLLHVSMFYIFMTYFTSHCCHFKLMEWIHGIYIRGYMQKFPDWLPLVRTANGTILWVSLVRFAAITHRVASQRVFIVVSVYFVIDSVRKLLDIRSRARACVYMYVCITAIQ